MIKGVVFFDYDGTLVDEREQIFEPSVKTKEAIQALKKQGYLCMLATGRALNYVPQGAKNLGLDGYVCCNGAYVEVHNEIIFLDAFSSVELLPFLNQLDQQKVNYILETHDYCYVKDMEDLVYQNYMKYFQIPEEGFIPLQDLMKVKNNIQKITLVPKSEQAMHDWMKRLETTYDCCRHREFTTFDVTKKTMHKGIGIQHVIDHFQIPFENTYAFGDGSNDVGLLKGVQYGIAMKTHASVLDDIAYMITDSVKEEGIYQALVTLEVLK